MAESSEHSVVIEQVVEQPNIVIEQAATMVEQAVTVTSMVEHNVAMEDDQPEAERKGLEKTAKQLDGVSLGISVTIIVAFIANKSSKSRGELMLLRTSATFALVCFLAWVTLLMFIQLIRLEKNILRGSIVIGIFFIATGVVLLGMNVVM